MDTNQLPNNKLLKIMSNSLDITDNYDNISEYFPQLMNRELSDNTSINLYGKKRHFELRKQDNKTKIYTEDCKSLTNKLFPADNSNFYKNPFHNSIYYNNLQSTINNQESKEYYDLGYKYGLIYKNSTANESEYYIKDKEYEFSFEKGFYDAISSLDNKCINDNIIDSLGEYNIFNFNSYVKLNRNKLKEDNIIDLEYIKGYTLHKLINKNSNFMYFGTTNSLISFTYGYIHAEEHNALIDYSLLFKKIDEEDLNFSDIHVLNFDPTYDYNGDGYVNDKDKEFYDELISSSKVDN